MENDAGDGRGGERGIMREVVEAVQSRLPRRKTTLRPRCRRRHEDSKKKRRMERNKEKKKERKTEKKEDTEKKREIER